MSLAKVIENYRTLGHKEFMKKFAAGVENITPLQQARIVQKSNWITMLGVVSGIIATAMNWKTMWWVVIILVGGFGISAMQIVAGRQKIKVFTDIENITKDVNENG